MTLASDTAELRKARGAFFTPPDLCRYVADWAVRTRSDRVLEPSCGEAAFMLSAGQRLDELGARRPAVLHGHELHAPSAAASAELVRAAGHGAEVGVGDFFSVAPAPRFDAVIGNPPYVRYQDFAGESRTRSREAALRAGVALSRLASSWAAFTVHAALFLKPGGRLGLVLPAELLSVNYAAEVRSFLMRRFGRVRLVLFKERVFPGVLEEVVLLLAEGEGPTDHCELLQVRDVGQLADSPAGVVTTWRPTDAEGKWTQALLPAAALEAYSTLQALDGVTMLQTWGDTTLGAVTGNNRFFALSPRRVGELGLQGSDLVKLSPPGSRHLRGLSFTLKAWEELARADTATWLFRPASAPSAAGSAYIAEGNDRGVDTAYKCRVRQPWWRVPLVPPADLLLTYMNADTPRLTTNRARVHHLNSVHGVYLRAGLRASGADLLPLASLNTLTLLGAETVGRAYGGGMLKLEPTEADALPVPAPALLESARQKLAALRPQMAVALREGRLVDAARMVDRVLLLGELGMRRSQVRALEEAHAVLTARRAARGRAAQDGR